MNTLRVPGLQRLLVWLVCAALLLPSLSGCASRQSASTPPVVLAGVVVDSVRLARPGEGGLVAVWRGGQRLEGVAGLALLPGDRVDTGASASAVVRWRNGNEVLMRPNSSGSVGSFIAGVGEFFAKIKGKFSVETQFVRAGVLGTQFLVRVAPSGETVVAVFDGRVEVGSTRGTWPSQVIDAGVQVVAHPRAPVVQPWRADEAARTREWVERVERLVPAQAQTDGSNVGKAIALAAVFAGIAILAGRERQRDRERERDAQRGPDPGSAITRRDAQAATPSAPVVPILSAPGGLIPGSDRESAPQPTRACSLYGGSLNTRLTWDGVPGADGYVLSLEHKPRRGSGAWQSLRRPDVSTTSADVALAQSEIHRWTVQARQGGTRGPAAPWSYFSCDFSPR